MTRVKPRTKKKRDDTGRRKCRVVRFDGAAEAEEEFGGVGAHEIGLEGCQLDEQLGCSYASCKAHRGLQERGDYSYHFCKKGK